MFTKRSFELLAFLALVGVAALTINAAIATSAVVSNGANVVTERQSSQLVGGGDLQVSPFRRNIHERLEERNDATAHIIVDAPISSLGRNIHERLAERDDAKAGNDVNTSIGGSNNGPDLSDYALRHPETFRSAPR